ncbi:hypothetical protein AYI68_g5167 [Smittium mucronatum]|uniref:Uncharacterized protein n=1 Tax=Smittium mucronatum TaxID=133383 RepID=A0A1R0GV05_9FUNG|nr:hypothetical protein AYI68_g5167 [Smittium mucronatum]
MKGWTYDKKVYTSDGRVEFIPAVKNTNLDFYGHIKRIIEEVETLQSFFSMLLCYRRNEIRMHLYGDPNMSYASLGNSIKELAGSFDKLQIDNEY